MSGKLYLDWHFAELLEEGLKEYGAKGLIEQIEAKTSAFKEKYYLLTHIDKDTIQRAVDYGFEKQSLKHELEGQYYEFFEEYSEYKKINDLDLVLTMENKIGVLDDVCEILERHGIVSVEVDRPKSLGF